MSRSHLEQIHAQIQLLRPKQGDHDYAIYTDGSGRQQDGWGGAAAIVLKNHPFAMTSRMMARDGTSVLEMEFQGLLLGLQACMDLGDLHSKEKIKMLRVTRPHVWWVTDREHLALSVWRDPETNEPIYKRRTPYPLWRAFEFYEEIFTITPIFTPRATVPYQHVADKLAGFGRSLMKHQRTEFLEQHPEIPE